jgi:hypothetical protein
VINKPLDIIVEHLSKMCSELYRTTGRKVVTRICVDSEVGLCMGIIPGTVATVHTAAGPVEVYCERELAYEWRHP